MLRCLVFFGLAFSLGAKLLPEKFGSWQRTAGPVTVAPLDADLWAENGFVSAEQSSYSSGNALVGLTAYRLQDPTGALAAWQALRPPDSTYSKLARYAAVSPAGTYVLHGNYVLLFDRVPQPAELKEIAASLPKVDRSSLPSLPQYLPGRKMIANSQRSILGPEALKRFAPAIPAAVARFDLGAEGQVARYALGGKEATIVLLSYPTPQIARLQTEALGKLEGAVVHRAGPLVAVVPGGKDLPGIQNIVESVSYNPSLMWNEEVPKPQGNPGEMLLAIVILAGVLIATSVLFGIAFGSFRVLGERFGIRTADTTFISLGLSDKQHP